MAMRINGTGPRSSHPALSRTDPIAATLNDLILLAGRIMMGWIFVMSGWGKLMDITGFANAMSARGVPSFFAYMAAPIEFIGGVFLVAGVATRYTTLVMFAFVVVATYISHRYWAVEPAQRTNQFNHFWKNISILGGLAFLFAAGPGRYSVDAWLRRREPVLT
jgi:putative oxidoreductase